MLLKSIGISLIRPDLGEDERENKLSGRPERFIQSRFQAYPISGATQEFARLRETSLYSSTMTWSLSLDG